jgi:hypothetical protein
VGERERERVWSTGGRIIGKETASYSERTLSIINATLTVLGLNPILRDEKPMINLFSCGTNKMALN